MALEETLISISKALTRIAGALETANALRGVSLADKPEPNVVNNMADAETEDTPKQELTPQKKAAQTRARNKAAKEKALHEENAKIAQVAQDEMVRQDSTAAPNTKPLVTEESFLPEDEVNEAELWDALPGLDPEFTRITFQNPATAKKDLHTLLSKISQKLGPRAAELQGVLGQFTNAQGGPCTGLNELPESCFEDMANGANKLLDPAHQIRPGEI